jgi:predicted CoA-binding protein
MAALAEISEFLSSGRVAVVGVSRDEKDFSRVLFREFVKHGYDAVPVHPGVAEMEGRPCFARVAEITPPVDAALVMTAPQVTNDVVKDCRAAGVNRVWMYRAAGAGAVSPEAVAYCQANGIRVVAGECPFMFFPDAGVVHRLHGFVRRITGRYPR